MGRGVPLDDCRKRRVLDGSAGRRPNGLRHLDLVFTDGEFEDLCFGSFSYELWESEDAQRALLEGIRDVMNGKSFCVVMVNGKNGKWLGDGLVSVEGCTLAQELEKLRRPKTWLERIFRTRRSYEVYDWKEYHCIER